MDQLVARSPLARSPRSLDELPAFLDRLPAESILHYAVAMAAKTGMHEDTVMVLHAIVDAAREVVSKGCVIRTPREFSIERWAPSRQYNLTVDSACDAIAGMLRPHETLDAGELSIQLWHGDKARLASVRLQERDQHVDGYHDGYKELRAAVARHPCLTWESVAGPGGYAHIRRKPEKEPPARSGMPRRYQ